MKNILKGGVAAAAVAMGLGATHAEAAGTTAGTSINNTVTVNFQVGGVSQNSVSASNSFTVDRKVNLSVSEDGSTTTTVSPGQTSAVTSFLVSNTSNAPLDLLLAATNRAGGASAHGGTDNFDVSNVRIYIDTNNDGVFNTANDTLATYADQVAADANVRVFVVTDIPLGRSTGDVAGVRLTATAAEANLAGSAGAVVTETAGANTAGMDTVFADTNANGNTARDGIHFAEDDYTVAAASMTATKTSTVISDPINGTTNPKLIPGATVEYCIVITNAAGSATASNVAVSDTLPGTTTYDSTFGVKVNGTVTAGACNADGAIAGSFAGGIVSGTIPSLAASATRTVLFRVTVN